MKVIVAHPFQQHSFKTATALKKDNILYKYITTVYLKKGTLTYLFSKVAKGDNDKRVKGRRCDSLYDTDVKIIAEWANMFLLLLQRIDKTKKIYSWWYWKTINIFNKKLVKYVKKANVDAVIVYDTLSSSFISLAKKKKLDVKIIVDMSAPNAMYMKYLFQEEERKYNKYSSEELYDIYSSYFEKKCKASLVELQNADAFLVASEFTKQSLKWNGIEDRKIYKCIYGVYDSDVNSFISKKDKKVIKCCFVGKVCLQKGAYRLFDAIDKVNRNDLEFHFYGSFNKNANYYYKYKEKCIFHGHIPHETMLKEFASSDIIIFPSFADGFGFSVTEAILRNNIAICSNNAGVSELIKNGENGFVYAPNDTEKLVDILNNIDKMELKKMQMNSPKTLINYTWDNYNNHVKAAIEKILE